MPAIVGNNLSLKWNLKQLVNNDIICSWGIDNEQLHLANYVSLIQGPLSKLRSTNQYNVFYRMLGNEFGQDSIGVNFIKNTILFNLFLRTASFDSLKTKWSVLLNFLFRKEFTENQYRNLLMGFRDAYFNRPSPANIKRSLQRALQIDNNKVSVYEFFKDSLTMSFFTNDWATRNDAVLVLQSTTNGTSVQNSPNKLRDTVTLGSATINQYAGYNLIITSGLGVQQIVSILSNDNQYFTIESNWYTPPDNGDSYTLSIINTKRDVITRVRPDINDYIPFGLSAYGFQVWVSIDNYLNVVSFINDFVKAIKQAYTIYSIAYILHRNFAGSLSTAKLNPSINPAFIAVGTGDGNWDPYNVPAPTGSETALFTEVSRKIALENYIDANENPSSIPTNSLELSGFFKPGIATSNRIVEVGLFSESGALLEYQTFNAINKDASEGFIWKWRMKYDSL